MPLGVGDYLDALRALQAGFGTPSWDPSIAAGSQPGRMRLRQLCKMLWARSIEEAQLIDAAINLVIPPSDDEITATESRLPSWASLALNRVAPMEPRLGVRASTQPKSAVGGRQPRVVVAFDSPWEFGGYPPAPTGARLRT